MKYSIQFLIDLIESDKIPASIKHDVSCLLESIDDWPNTVDDLDDFERQLTESVHAELTIINLKNYAKELCVKKDAWKMEALSSLYRLYDRYAHGVVLHEILNPIKRSVDELKTAGGIN
ncbi:hypothetical protein [Sphingobacterium griseoflavum]|uniref:Uncharacterized protein n=1 Tax=Sphingobacterium griseoflavum TaxID=1474952 RepID=A0ABQ3HQD5_9SPHI|nr:hypothetical protein [Sphingobacterium griseoflavum]GHE23334.1 hypothetical protein GCM10017764_03020 [Sphingobacterium griseoflavum]